MVKFRKTVCGEEFTVVRKNNGDWAVCLIEKDGRIYSEDCNSFHKAGLWVWNMADNHDIGSKVCEAMCEKFGTTFMDMMRLIFKED